MAATAKALKLDDLQRARDHFRGRLHRTPIFHSATLGQLAGGRVFLKAELFQKTGSFKPRGVLNNLAALSAEQRARGVISISAGNHAQALAWGAASEGVDALVVMWQGASEAKIAATRGYGAAVDLEAVPAGEGRGEAVGDRPRGDRDRLSGRKGLVHRGRELRLDADHTPALRGEGDPGDQASATHWDD